YDVDLVGGDTTSSQKGFIISVTAIGEVAPDKYVKRSTAQKGDLLCVSGNLGGAYVGLLFLEREKKIFLESPGVQPDLEGESYVIDPTACALSGGEDYELLFTIPQSEYDKLILNEQISVVGYMTGEEEGAH